MIHGFLLGMTGTVLDEMMLQKLIYDEVSSPYVKPCMAADGSQCVYVFFGYMSGPFNCLAARRCWRKKVEESL